MLNANYDLYSALIANSSILSSFPDYVDAGAGNKFCPPNTSRKTRTAWTVKMESNGYKIYDDNDVPVDWSTIGNMIPQ